MAQKGQAPVRPGEEDAPKTKRSGKISRTLFLSNIPCIEVRKELTDEWKRTGVHEGLEYASLTDIITREWSGFTTKQYKHHKGLKKENLRDNMTNLCFFVCKSTSFLSSLQEKGTIICNCRIF